ncbi:MAG: pyridoxal phosphate-dependent aminotransferase [Clostridia bacterium]|nr:pyridoxal phosphate-dependent aminotransferase [Clostridia bacterium]
MYALGASPSVIRAIFEYSLRRRAEIGEENVFDFSIGNPSVPPPAAVTDALLALVRDEPPVALHGYTSGPGAFSTRVGISEDYRRRFGVPVRPEDVYVTCGAAASLTVTLSALCEPGDEVILLSPFFPEYRVFVERAGGVPVVVPCRPDDFQPDVPAIAAAVTPRTRALIVNTPNNPTGVAYTPAVMAGLADALARASERVGRPVYLISDEPYRELVYDRPVADSPMKLYPRTVVCYSYSKSLSLPGERIGYIALAPDMPQGGEVFAAICGAGRALGFVCAPSLMQKLITACPGMTADLSVYRANRDLLFDALTEDGFDCVRPDGAFYLFVRSPLPDAAAFSEEAKKEEILFVPSDSFGTPGYVRIAYCVAPDVIRRSLPAFARLAVRCGLKK